MAGPPVTAAARTAAPEAGLAAHRWAVPSPPAGPVPARPEPMRVALLGPVTTGMLRPWLRDTPELPDGMGGVPVTFLARALLDAGHEVEIVSMEPTVRDPVTAAGDRLRLQFVPYRPRHRGRDAYGEERRHMARALETVDADVLHAHWSYEYALAALATGIPTVVTVHDWAPRILRFYPIPYRVVKLGMHAAVMARGPAAVTTPSPYLARRLRRTGARRVTVVPNGLPATWFVDRPRTRRPSAPDASATLLAVGSGFSPLKNTATLLRAHALLRAQARRVTLVLLGVDHGHDGPAADWAAAQGLADGVTFGGLLPHTAVTRHMDAADVLVHPSREESFGMVLVEAMARGLPVVAGRGSGAVPWVLDGGRCGVLADVGKPRAVAAAVATLLDDPDRYRALSQQALTAARARFTMDRVLQGYLDAYRSAVRHG